MEDQEDKEGIEGPETTVYRAQSFNEKSTVKTTQLNNLFCWYSNADVLTNMMAELRLRLHNSQTTHDLVMITEVNR